MDSDGYCFVEIKQHVVSIKVHQYCLWTDIKKRNKNYGLWGGIYDFMSLHSWSATYIPNSQHYSWYLPEIDILS